MNNASNTGIIMERDDVGFRQLRQMRFQCSNPSFANTFIEISNRFSTNGRITSQKNLDNFSSNLIHILDTQGLTPDTTKSKYLNLFASATLANKKVISNLSQLASPLSIIESWPSIPTNHSTKYKLNENTIDFINSMTDCKKILLREMLIKLGNPPEFWATKTTWEEINLHSQADILLAQDFRVDE